jgi:hypothetical protein
MLKTIPRRPTMALGFALLVIAWLVSLLPSPSCEPPKPTDKTKETSNNLKKDCPTIFGAVITYVGHFVHDNRDEITASSTAIIAVFTAILGVFTIRLAKSTRIAAIAAKDSAKVAKDSLIAANRPAIAITSLGLCEANEFQTAAHINFRLVNNGNGTAIVNYVSAIVSSEYGGIGLATNPPINSLFVPSDVNGDIEPGQPMSGHPITAPFLGAQELQQIKSGGRTLRIIFNITFEDKFNNGYMPTISFDFDHRQGIFVTRSRLIPTE